MHYQRCFSLKIFHEYYRDGVCSDFSIEPTRACQKLLNGHRLLIKPTVNGLWVLRPLDGEQQPVFPLAESVTLTFLLKLKNPAFISFTQLDAGYSAIASLYSFSNQTLQTPGTMDLPSVLVQRSALHPANSGASDLETRLAKIAELKTAERRTVFGVVDIRNNGSIPTNGSTVSEFRMPFAAKAKVWKYYLIAAKTSQSSAYSIHDEDAGIVFAPVELDPSDRVVSAIRYRFPESRPVLFQSETQVPCQEAGRQNIQLLKTGHTKPWIPHLPNPPNHHGAQVINLLEDV
ncbi:MAG: hypothetical protein QNJ46_09210 [Leptolyngbyaceae cyanobacterium MO_188.B28]|nr:hypothetical protein [Leptolyngbyaceae cyanobacterium MO_188.B28]